MFIDDEGKKDGTWRGLLLWTKISTARKKIGEVSKIYLNKIFKT